MSTWVAIATGCTECYGGMFQGQEDREPILGVLGRFDSKESAIAFVESDLPETWSPTWYDHPAGGVVSETSMDAVWVVSLEDLGRAR